MNRSVDSAAARQGSIRSCHDSFDGEGGDVAELYPNLHEGDYARSVHDEPRVCQRRQTVCVSSLDKLHASRLIGEPGARGRPPAASAGLSRGPDGLPGGGVAGDAAGQVGGVLLDEAGCGTAPAGVYAAGPNRALSPWESGGFSPIRGLAVCQSTRPGRRPRLTCPSHPATGIVSTVSQRYYPHPISR